MSGKFPRDNYRPAKQVIPPPRTIAELPPRPAVTFAVVTDRIALECVHLDLESRSRIHPDYPLRSYRQCNAGHGYKAKGKAWICGSMGSICNSDCRDYATESE